MLRKPLFYILPQVLYEIKKNTNHWVGYLLREPIDVDKLFNRRVIISELETSLNDYDAIDASGITEGKT